MEPRINWNEWIPNLITKTRNGIDDHFWIKNWNDRVPDNIKSIIQQHSNNVWKNPQNSVDIFQSFQSCEAWEFMIESDKNRYRVNIGLSTPQVIIIGGLTYADDMSHIYRTYLGTDIPYRNLLSQLSQIRRSGQSGQNQTEIDQLRTENTNFRQALEMIMTQSQQEFDKTAVIIGYTRQTQILQDMFLEQRRVLSQQLEQLTGINIPGSRSMTQFTIALMVNRIKRYFDDNEISELIPQTRINTTQESIDLNLSGIADEIFKQFFPKKQDE